MLGKVHGPYKGKQGKAFVIIILHNEDGSIKERKTISYEKYLEEYEQGLHHYEAFYRAPSAREQIRKANKIRFKEITENKINCAFCKTEITLKRLPRINNYFCSKNCREKYKRKVKNKSVIVYYRQIVIEINKKDKDNKHFIIYERDSSTRNTYFIPANKCTLIIDEDENGVKLYRLHYDKENAVRIRTVPGYKKYFWITESGVFVSRRSKKILSQTLSKTGYWTHSTRIGGRDGQVICFKIHRLVALAFIPNPENKPEVNHINGIKTDNHWTNLEWVTGKENSNHAFSNGLAIVRYGEENSAAKLTNEQVKEIRALAGSMTHREIANKYKVGHSKVTNIINNKTYIDLNLINGIVTNKLTNECNSFDSLTDAITETNVDQYLGKYNLLKYGYYETDQYLIETVNYKPRISPSNFI